MKSLNKQKILSELLGGVYKNEMQGSFLNIKALDETRIKMALDFSRQFSFITQNYKVKKEVKENKTYFSFFFNKSKIKEIIINENGNILKPRGVYEAITDIFVWVIKLRYYIESKNKVWFPVSKWEKKGSFWARKYQHKAYNENIVRLKDKFGNQIQVQEDDLEFSFKEFEAPKTDIYFFKNELLKNPDILGKNKTELAKQFGVSRRTIFNWLKELSISV